MTTHITVRPARPDLRVPTGVRPGEYFTMDPVEVERTRHIERRLADGDLVEFPTAPATPPMVAATRKRGEEA